MSTNTTNATCSTGAVNQQACSTSTSCTGNATKPTGVNLGAGFNESATCNTSATNPTAQSCQTKSTGLNESASKSSCPVNTDAQTKDFYHLLGVGRNASQSDIELAYRRLAARWHPQRNLFDRVNAQRMFNDITHAYSVLSNQARRDHYDQLTGHHYTKDEALKTFERFFKHNGIEAEEQPFFERHYPNRKPNYYEILGVERNASFQEVDAAYRKKGIELHPKNRPEDADAEKKFVALTEAYITLRNAERRRTYDNIEFGELPSHHAHRQFVEQVEECPVFHGDEKNKELGGLVKKLSHKGSHHGKNKGEHHQQGHRHPHMQSVSEEYTKETVQSSGPEGTTSKTVTHRSSLVNGKHVDVRVEEITKPDGTTEVTETVNDSGNIKTNKFSIKAGEKLPAIGV